MSMDCIRSRGFDRLNLSRAFKHSKLNHGLFFLYWVFFLIFFHVCSKCKYSGMVKNKDK